jgi:SAM-dependent methyltransferase
MPETDQRSSFIAHDSTNDHKYWLRTLSQYKRTTYFIESIKHLIYNPAKPPVFIVDGGCGSGVGTIELKALFPEAHLIVGVDNQEISNVDLSRNTKESVTLDLENQDTLRKEDTASVQFIRGDYYSKLFVDNVVDIFLILNSFSFLYVNDQELLESIDTITRLLSNIVRSLNPNNGKLVIGINSVDGDEGFKDVIIMERVNDTLNLIGDEEIYKNGRFSFSVKRRLALALSEVLVTT